MAGLLTGQLPEHLSRRLSAKRRERGVQIFCLVLAIVALVSASLLMRPINRVRREQQLVIDPQSIAGLPPHIAIAGKLGTFRGLLITAASIKADNLQREGKVYEAYDLHNLICSLAPRMAKMWGTAAWNMSYNISVMQYTPEARWKWVSNGIELLRDRGLQYNKRSATLYKELAYIFWHKVGGYLDDHHLDYKKALAVDMERVLGPQPAALSEEEYLAWFSRIADAPENLASFLESDQSIQPFVSRLEALDLSPDASLLDFVAREMRSELRAEDLVASPTERDEMKEARVRLMKDEALAGPRERLLAALRSDVFRNRYHMEPKRMRNLMTRFGPLDWRNCFAHGLYWSELGDEMSDEHDASDLNDKINNARMILFALQSMVTRGHIVLRPDFDNPFKSYIDMAPDTRLIPYLFNAYLDYGRKYFANRPDFRENTAGPVFMTGFVSNMHVWIELLYLEGGERNEELARQYYAYLREYNPHPDGSTQERYLGTMSEFIMSGITDRLLTYTAVNGIVQNFLERALKHYALDQLDAGSRAVRWADLAYKQWMKDTKDDLNVRRKLPPFENMLADKIEVFMKSPAYRPLAKANLWRNLRLQDRQYIYDHLRSYFERLCSEQDPPWSMGRAFAEPPGMEEARARKRTYEGGLQEEAEQGERVQEP